MKVLLINGSPHEHGCTYRALCEIEKTLREEGIDAGIFQLGAAPILGCTGCGACENYCPSHAMKVKSLSAARA